MASESLQPGLVAKFDADQYWIDSGPYLAGPGIGSPEHGAVQGLLSELLPSLGPIDDVLDVGCGRGRIAALLKEVLPETRYHGVDIGEAQVEATKKVRPDGQVYHSRIQDFEFTGQVDLVIVSEVLMHIPPDDIQGVCDKLKTIARKAIVAIEWTEPLDVPIAPWNWLYNYPALFGGAEKIIPTGLQSIFVIRP